MEAWRERVDDGSTRGRCSGSRRVAKADSSGMPDSVAARLTSAVSTSSGRWMPDAAVQGLTLMEALSLRSLRTNAAVTRICAEGLHGPVLRGRDAGQARSAGDAVRHLPLARERERSA